MEIPGRRYLCARCRKAVTICSHCDRGHRYCSDGCSQAARQCAVRDAGRRYQATRQGQHRHAERQHRYRVRMARHALRSQKVTHQGSPPGPVVDLLTTEPTAPETPSSGRCDRCHRPLPAGVRQDFLRCRVRHFRQNRSTYGPYPRN